MRHRVFSAALVGLAACGGNKLTAYDGPDSATPPSESGAPTDTEDPPIEDTEDSGHTEETDSPDDSAVDTGEAPLGDPTLLCHAELSCGLLLDALTPVPCGLTLTAGDGPVIYDGRANLTLAGRVSDAFPKPSVRVDLLREGALELLPPGSTWRYLDAADYPGSTWAAPGFDDSAWAEGPAPLGYGDAQITVLDYGPDPAAKHITAWFRTSFHVDDVPALPDLVLGLMRDDGAVVYLNGTEILRDNMPFGGITSASLAASSVGGAAETTFMEAPLPKEWLVNGENVLAIEVHQADLGSSDLTLDATIREAPTPLDDDLFGFGAGSQWSLDGMYPDRSLLRTRLIGSLFRDFAPANYAPETAWCDLTVDGVAMGVYLLAEGVTQGPDRLDIPSDPGDGTSFVVQLVDGEGLVDNVGGAGAWSLVYPAADGASSEQIAGTLGWLTAWQGAYNGASPEAIFDWVDLDSAVDFVIAQELARNVDGYTHFVHLAKEPGGKLTWVPGNADLSIGQPTTDGHDAPEGFIASRPPYVAKMGEVTAFRAALEARWTELRGGPLKDGVLTKTLDGHLGVLADADDANFTVWPIVDITYDVGGANALYAVSSHDEELLRVRGWLAARTAWLDDHIGEW